MIKAEGLVKLYGDNPVLRGMNLQVAAGEFLTLAGPNGAGKSTFLRIVATLLRPSGGDISVGGWSLPRQAQRVRAHISLVSHQALLYGDLTAEENLLFFARLYSLDRRAERVNAALKQVGLSTRARDLVRTFSRGMLQRLTLARATLHEPELLLFDEPYTGLDPEATQMLDDLLQRERARGRTILMVTHDLVRGLSLCDRVAVLAKGKIATTVPQSELSPAGFLALYAAHTGQRHTAPAAEGAI